jgi:hypothetical protein
MGRIVSKQLTISAMPILQSACYSSGQHCFRFANGREVSLDRSEHLFHDGRIGPVRTRMI